MSEPQQFRKLPVVVEAMQLVGSNAETHAVYRWVEENTLGTFECLSRIEGEKPWPESGVSIDPRDGRLVIATLEGPHWANLGDWIIRGVKGEFYPVKNSIFRETCEPVGAEMNESEAEQIRLGLEEWDESPWEWGVYVERNDSSDGEDYWIPVVYGRMESFRGARLRFLNFFDATPGIYRNPLIVRRAVGPWEVRHDD